MRSLNFDCLASKKHKYSLTDYSLKSDPRNYICVSTGRGIRSGYISFIILENGEEECLELFKETEFYSIDKQCIVSGEIVVRYSL